MAIYRRFTWIRSLSFLLLFSFMGLDYLANSAEAKRPRKRKKPNVSQALKDLNWGESHYTVIKYLEKIIRKRYRKAISSSYDGLKADKLRKEMRAEIESLKGNYFEFNGQRTGYAVTFIKDDFIQNNGETMLKFDEGSRQRYFFFRYDELWKIVVSYPVMGTSSFESFVTQVKGKYGRSAKQDWETPYGGSRHMVRAIWEDDKTRLVLEDKSSFYGCFVMKLISRVKGDEITKLHEARKPKKTTDLATPQKIGGGNIDIFGEEENMDEVVDQITGTKHDVKLDRIDFVPAESEHVIKDKKEKKKQ